MVFPTASRGGYTSENPIKKEIIWLPKNLIYILLKRYIYYIIKA
jgi:hypothetical protein